MKKILEEAHEIFGEMRNFTKEEAEAYSKMLKKISKPTGKNFFDLIDEEETFVKK